MRRYLFALPVIVVMALLSSCGSDECVILVNGGRRLCGSEAVAWCEGSEEIRKSVGGLTSLSNEVKKTEELCEKIEAASK